MNIRSGENVRFRSSPQRAIVQAIRPFCGPFVRSSVRLYALLVSHPPTPLKGGLAARFARCATRNAFGGVALLLLL